jgi:NADH-quinone oxidoreductase subunit L
LTAFYMFRLIFMTFFGEYRGHGAAAHGAHGHDDHGHSDHDAHAHDKHARDAHGGHGHDDHGHGHAHTPHESPWPMTVALVCLAVLGVLGGHFWLATPTDPLANHTKPWFENVMSLERAYGGLVAEPHMDEHAQHIEHQAHTMAVTASLSVAAAGILLAFLMYFAKKIDPARVARGLGELYHTVANKYYIDEFVNATVIRLVMTLALVQKWIDENIVDGFVNGVGWTNKQLGFFHAWFDRVFVDGAVNGVASTTQIFGSLARLVQTGRIQQYVSYAVAGGLAAAAWLILS